MHPIRVAGPALLILALAAPTRAQFPSTGGPGKMLHFWIGGGVSVPVSDAGDAFDTGIHGRGMVTLQPPGLPIALRADISFQKFSVKSPYVTGGEDSGSLDPTTQILSGLANATFGFNLGPLRPYVGAGLGAFRVTSDSGADGAESDSQTKFGINGIAGTTFRLGQNVNLFVEGRIENIFTDEGQQIDSLNDIQVVPVTFGIVF